jgi:hypothetical protein
MKDTCVIAFSNFLSLIRIFLFFAYRSIKASFVITVMVYHPHPCLWCTVFSLSVFLTNCYKRRFIYSCKMTLGNMSRYIQSHCLSKKGADKLLFNIDFLLNGLTLPHIGVLYFAELFTYVMFANSQKYFTK